jgi:hypothetical protein
LKRAIKPNARQRLEAAFKDYQLLIKEAPIEGGKIKHL